MGKMLVGSGHLGSGLWLSELKLLHIKVQKVDVALQLWKYPGLDCIFKVFTHGPYLLGAFSYHLSSEM